MAPVPESPRSARAIQPVDTRPLPLHLDVRLFASGLSAGLNRRTRCSIVAPPLLDGVATSPAWRPNWPRVTVNGLQFPEPAVAPVSTDFAPLAPAPPAPATRPQPVLHTSRNPETRLPVPRTALSVPDRLYYLLQPPLETLLSGQELLMPAEPFPFQYQGIAWLFSQTEALLADEMGLGKTMQAISALRLLLRAGQVRSTLIVCPKPLISNWERELMHWAEELPFVTITGPLSRRHLLWTMPDTPVKLANYELLARDLAAIGESEFPEFDLVILDEAQRIKNRDSHTSQAARGIPRKRSWALTCTPIENRAEDFVTLLEFLRVLPDGSSPNLRQLTHLAQDHVLRRTKDRVLTDLPPRLDHDDYIDLTPSQQEAYHTAEQDGIIQLTHLGETLTIQHVFELILRLKQIANFDPLTGHSSKLDRIRVAMEEIAESGGKAILFSQWRHSLDWLHQQLESFHPLLFHGSISTRQRTATLEQFEHDPDSHLLLMSYGVGAVGLNLQFAGYVFLFDRWWNPAVEDQAINRAHRIGQQNPLFVTKFICRDTIEERIDSVLQKKRELFETLLGQTEATNTSLGLNAQEIFSLFDLKAGTADDSRSISPPSLS